MDHDKELLGKHMVSENDTLRKQGPHCSRCARACTTPWNGSLLQYHHQGTQRDTPSQARGQYQGYAPEG